MENSLRKLAAESQVISCQRPSENCGRGHKSQRPPTEHPPYNRTHAGAPHETTTVVSITEGVLHSGRFDREISKKTSVTPPAFW